MPDTPDQFPIDGMTVKPLYFSTDDWYSLYEAPFLSLVHYAMGEAEARDRFKLDTGNDLSQLVGRSPMEKAIDTACGREKQMMAAFCDWVATTMWGVDE